MPGRICPECNASTDAENCPQCGLRTLRIPTPQADTNLGRVLEGRYRVDALLGRGGMGAVYRGIQLATGQAVAVKLIRPEQGQSLEAAKRFQREARAASRLSHPHTVKVIDFGQEEGGDLYLVLEYLAGRTLSAVISEAGTLPEARVLKVASEVAQALAEAHSAGLVHRDLKPENVMLVDTFGDADFAKVLDFGIAKVLSGSTGESSVTRTGTVIGTPQYMAPEQATDGRAITPAVDVYSLGIMLFQALTGQKPFDGDSAVGVLMAHVREPVPELPADAPVSDGLRTLLRRMLAKAPGERPGAAELIPAFEALRSGGPIAGVVAPPRTPTGGHATLAEQQPTPRPDTLVDASDLPQTRALEVPVPASAPMPAPAVTPTPTPLSTPAGEIQVRRPRPWRWAVLVTLLLAAGAAAAVVAFGDGESAETPAPMPAVQPAPAPTPVVDPRAEPTPAFAPRHVPSPSTPTTTTPTTTTTTTTTTTKVRRAPAARVKDDLPALRIDGGAR